MRRSFFLFIPAFITPLIMAFIVPSMAYNAMDADLKANQIIRANLVEAGVSDTATLSGNWVLQPVLASDTVTDRIPYIRFDLKKNEFSGFTGCNKMGGSLMVRGNRLFFNPDISLTKMICQGYNEKAFIANLLRVTNYKIKEGVLNLMIDNLPVSKWARKTPPMPIEKSI